MQLRAAQGSSRDAHNSCNNQTNNAVKDSRKCDNSSKHIPALHIAERTYICRMPFFLFDWLGLVQLMLVSCYLFVLAQSYKTDLIVVII